MEKKEHEKEFGKRFSVEGTFIIFKEQQSVEQE